MRSAHTSFGLVGALAAFPFRLAVREVKRQGRIIRRGITRRTTTVVFGRRLLERAKASDIEAMHKAAGGREIIGECAFLRRLGLMERSAQQGVLSREALSDQAKLPLNDLDMLALFDAFEEDHEPFSFRDLILAKKYAGLVADGADWLTIARSIHRSGEPEALTALTLKVDERAGIHARTPHGQSELDGQLRLPMPSQGDTDLDELFVRAEAAEASGDYTTAIDAYRRCIAMDPNDAVLAFNLANCLHEAGQPADAERYYLRAVKLDPGFAEAWFNFGGLLREQGKLDGARRHLKRAIDLDASYADPVFNLAALEFDASNFSEARLWWKRYLELDQHSEWAQRARRGVQFVDLQEAAKARSK
ncbi:MAG TPA: tetratricopeptide repeat protein [Rhizobiaceae bacterium]|nr:tetratricopeptide repeat protein [Rhizobiaceae bacterium]